MSRRLVVVLFLDLVGWTRLSESVDPEPLQQLLENYYEICSTAVEEHGGVVEKFIGDAIMAVFGADTSQEDDAPRALRAATRIRAEVGELRTPDIDAPQVEIHCGIAAGVALVTRSAVAGIRVVGDVVNLAARLQSAAVAGEIVVNEVVAHLARQHFAMVPIPPLTLKGKAEPVPALVVTGQATAGFAADDRSRMVDRSAERHRLREAFHRVARDRRPEVVTVLGPPGIGKTRLVRAVADELVTAGAEPVAVFGNCPSYGLNGNDAALVEVLEALTRQAAGAELFRADSRVAAVVSGLSDSARSRRAGANPGPVVEEVFWATRELLAAAAVRPLVVVWDSLEWASGSLLRLIFELAESLTDLPLLMVCVGRPELAELDAPWMRGPRDGEVIDVGALAPGDSVQLAALLAADELAADVVPHSLDLAERVAISSAGNPLFIRLMVEWATAGRALEDMPPTITAMVGAMIDRLPEPARRLLGAASVVGPAFTLDQVALLGETASPAIMEVLLEQRLFRPTDENGGFRFVQQPVHEVAYGRLEKERRLAWHRRLAECDFSPAFHFEAAMRFMADLRPNDAELPRLARHAAEALLQEGTTSLRQRDMPAAIELLSRALDLTPGTSDPWRSVASIRLSDALMFSGDTPRALEVARRQDQLPCLVQQHLLQARLGKVADVDVEKLLADLVTDRSDRFAWCRFEQLRMLIHLGEGRFGAAEQAAIAALEHSRAIGDPYEEDRLLVALCEVRQWSPTPVEEQLAGCAELLERFAADRFLLLPALAARARCLALMGDRVGARTALAEAESVVEQLRVTIGRVLVDQVAGLASSLEGEHGEAEWHYRAAADALEKAGHTPIALTMRVQAARERSRLPSGAGAAEEIAALLERHDEMDFRGRLLCMAAQARLAAESGRRDSALDDLPHLLQDTDDPCLRGEISFDLAQAHRHLGDMSEARVSAAAAIDSYLAVGATKPLGQVRAWM
ncbi:AAA family ATPase [Streptomyces sp. QTS52]